MPQISSKRIPRFFEMAKKASEDSDFHQHRLGSVIVYKGSKLATGYNTTRTSPVQKQYNRLREDYDVDDVGDHMNSLHSEMMALGKIKYLDIDFSKASIFVYRETRRGRKAMARPCEACRAAIRELGIRDIYYTVDNGWCYERMD